ncbi:MAG: hypothetical protein IKO74_07850 [Selenomonadaceae bacterium]|nr:hypothetical protein [Selenomonadaceae bacterium]
MFVYTFWEPRENIPYYLRLCMETWKKFLPNATIVVLDYKNINEFLDVRELGLNLFSGKLSLPQISDAIRIALLAKHGGVWLDIDTIILSSNVEKYFLPEEKHRTILFYYSGDNFCQMCFINTPPNAMCMNLWREFVRERIWNLKHSVITDWSFVGNDFIDEYSKKYPDEFKLIDRNIAMPDKDLISDSKKGAEAAYITYYFLRNYHLQDISNELLFLQNSWTPYFFKNFSREEFFRCDCTMTNFLAEALEIKLPSPDLRFRIKLQKSN